MKRLLLTTILLLITTNLVFAQQYQKVKWTVVIRGTEHGEYTKSDWVNEEDVPKLFELLKIDQKNINTSLQEWNEAEAYAKAHPAPIQEPTKQDYINLYNERMSEANNYLSKYIETANSSEIQSIKDNLISNANLLQFAIDEKDGKPIEVVITE